MALIILQKKFHEGFSELQLGAPYDMPISYEAYETFGHQHIRFVNNSTGHIKGDDDVIHEELH